MGEIYDKIFETRTEALIHFEDLGVLELGCRLWHNGAWVADDNEDLRGHFQCGKQRALHLLGPWRARGKQAKLLGRGKDRADHTFEHEPSNKLGLEVAELHPSGLPYIISNCNKFTITKQKKNKREFVVR